MKSRKNTQNIKRKCYTKKKKKNSVKQTCGSLLPHSQVNTHREAKERKRGGERGREREKNKDYVTMLGEALAEIVQVSASGWVGGVLRAPS